VASSALSGLGDVESERFAGRNEAVEEPLREPDVVVNDDDPVELLDAHAAEDGVQVLELAARQPCTYG
jgi:hypothetical protein